MRIRKKFDYSRKNVAYGLVLNKSESQLQLDSASEVRLPLLMVSNGTLNGLVRSKPLGMLKETEHFCRYP